MAEEMQDWRRRSRKEGWGERQRGELELKNNKEAYRQHASYTPSATCNHTDTADLAKDGNLCMYVSVHVEAVERGYRPEQLPC